MILDDRTEALDPQAVAGRRRIFGLHHLVALTTLAAGTLVYAVEPGTVEIDGKVQEFAGDGSVTVNSGGTLGDGNAIVAAHVVYYNPITDRMYALTVEGDEATTATAVGPTDDEIAAALPNAEYAFARAFEVTFARASSVITQSVNHTVREYGVPAGTKAVTAGADDDGIADGDLYVFSHTERITRAAAAIADGDLLTDKPCPPFHGKFGNWRVICDVAITTGAKTTTLDVQIGSTSVDGMSTAYAGTKALGAVTALTPPTAGHASNKFKPGDVWSILAGSTTSFSEGTITIEVDVHRKVTSPAG